VKQYNFVIEFRETVDRWNREMEEEEKEDLSR
jgi:hypothetical protein